MSLVGSQRPNSCLLLTGSATYVVRVDADLVGKGLGSLPLSAEQQARLVELAAQAQSTTQQPGQVCSLPALQSVSAWMPRPHLCSLLRLSPGAHLACGSLAASGLPSAVGEKLHLQESCCVHLPLGA